MTSSRDPTLDQLRVLTAVVESGSFSAAAKRLNRAQSAVSYAVANLEAELGVPLFQRGLRRPALTEAGQALLADARQVAESVDALRARAAGLMAGLEAEVSLVVDVMFPTAVLVAALDEFARLFPTVALRLRIEALGAVAQLVQDGHCRMGISGPMVEGPGLERRRLHDVELWPVAAPHHPLARLPAPIPSGALRGHTQLVLTDRSRLTEGRDYGVLSGRTWRLGDMGAKHALLVAGLGWGNMPVPMVRGDLAAGRLVRLPLEEAPDYRFRLFLIHRADRPPGPAGQWLARRFADCAPAPDSGGPASDGSASGGPASNGGR